MTFKEFLDTLEHYTAVDKGSWVKEKYGKLRYKTAYYSGDYEYCPITFVAMKMTGQRHHLHNFQDAAQQIGLDHKLAIDIVYAADRDMSILYSKGSGYTGIRSCLLDATKVGGNLLNKAEDK